ncbi:MAG TPA: pilus assembly protein PilZ [Bacillales bacterium]|nr:pilus assembly protein PilZ [Bacillales bacterium]
MLNIGDTLNLEIKYSDSREKFKCKIVDKRGNQLLIDYPVSEKTGKTAFFLDGTEIKVSFFAKDNGAYMFESEIIGRTKENIPMIIISYPGQDKLFRVQRREFVRIDASVDMAVHSINDEFMPFTTVTVDISAGGAVIILPPNHNFKSQTQILCYLVLPLSNGEYNYIKVHSKIIRIINGDMGTRDKAPIQFIDLKEAQIQQIMRYCFERQLTERKRER